jgi:pimeloyl-ACP methyl ester carboxylesterase
MSTFLLLPGAGGVSWYWHRVVGPLRAAGHDVIAVDLPGDDPQAGLPEYVELVAEAAAGHDDIVLVAQSMGAFTALPVSERLPVRRLVLNNAMLPLPGERATDWWSATGSEAARVAAARAAGYPEAMDLDTYFLHDVPADVVAQGAALQRDEADIAFEQPCAFAHWPHVPTTVLAGCDDRLFPLAFQRRVASDRVGLPVTELPGGHLNALSRPDELAQALLSLA